VLAHQSPIVPWPYPIDPWPGEPLPDKYDLLIYAKNGIGGATTKDTKEDKKKKTGCATVGARTGASLVRHGVTGLIVQRMPPGMQCVASDTDEATLTSYLDAIHQRT